MEELFLNVKAYFHNELDGDLNMSLRKLDGDWWEVIVSDGDGLDYTVDLRYVGTYQGQPMVEIKLDRYGDIFSEIVQASDHVVARLVYC